jgi:patatin-related protein
MRGGVSLAVWIGGACAEIDALRRAAPTTDDPGAVPFWRELLARSPFDSVVVDVLAGASAGGLNGVLYAASQVYGFSFDHIRDVWLQVGGLECLVRRPPWPQPNSARGSGDGEKGPYAPSLLRGDEYFQNQVAERLAWLVGEADAERAPVGGATGGGDRRPPRTVDLRLSATVVEPIMRPVPGIDGEDLRQRRFASGFHFRHSDLPWERSDFPPLPSLAPPAMGAPPSAAPAPLARLASAARSTSSFPGAFEAAVAKSGRPQTFFDEAEPEDLREVFLDRRGDDELFYLSDGGILDNIPLGRALDAIAASPADGPTERVLVYLQPGLPNAPARESGEKEASASTASVEAADLQARRSTVAVLSGMAGARIGSETIDGDVAQLEAHNAGVLGAQAVRRATFGPMLLDAAERTPFRRLGERAARQRYDYLQQRADEDARLIRGLLADPVGTLGEDRFPASAGGQDLSDDQWRSPVAAWPAVAREELLIDLQRAFARRDPEGDVLRMGVRPVTRVTLILLEWARYLERQPDANGASASVQKERLYRVLAVAESFLERPRRLAWVGAVASWTTRRQTSTPDQAKPSAIEVHEVAPMVAAIQATVDGLCTFDVESLDTLRAWIEAGADGDDRRNALRRAHCSLMRRVDLACRDGGTTVVAGDRPVDLRDRLAEILVSAVSELHSCRPATPDAAAPTEWTMEQSAAAAPAELLDRVLGAALDRTEERPADPGQLLRDLEVVCYPEFAAGQPGRRPIELVHLSSANPTPLASRFTALLEAARCRGLWWDRENHCPERQQGIHVNLKLAGNELANFSAFLLERWRANDWMWGRMDAVPSLVKRLVRPEPFRRAFADAEEATAFVRRLLDEGAPAKDGVATWAQLGRSVNTQLQALFDATEGAVRSVDLSAVHTALVAARQWEILRCELASLPSAPLGHADDATLLECITTYRVGAETIRKNPDWPTLVDRFTELGAAAAQAAVWNAKHNDRFRPKLPKWAATAITRATPWVTHLATKKLLAPSDRRTDGSGTARPGAETTKTAEAAEKAAKKAASRRRRRRLILSLAAAAIFVVGVLGAVMDYWAFLFGVVVGLVVGLAVVFPLTWLGWRLAKRLLGTDAPPVLGRSAPHGDPTKPRASSPSGATPDCST